jgi:midasin
MLEGEMQIPQQQLLHQVLPDLVHGMWYSWQAGLWAGSEGLGGQQDGVYGSAMRSFGVSRPADGADSSGLGPRWIKQIIRLSKVFASPLALHLATQTASVLQIVESGAADGASKPARLLQLSLAAQHLLRQQQQQQQQGLDGSSASWQSLALLFCQLLLAHTSSLQRSVDQAALQQMLQQMLSWCRTTTSSSSSSSSSSPASPLSSTEVATRQLWCQSLRDLIQHSTHSTLLGTVDTLLLPCAEAILLQTAPASATSTQRAAAAAAVPWSQPLAAQGWAWLLLGCARLQLVVPPPGVDPAGRYGYKSAALQRWVGQELEPAIQVRNLLQQLPGGPDESVALHNLQQQRCTLLLKLQGLKTRCVPRPDPPQYLHLQKEVAAFTQGLAEPQRLVALGHKLLASSSGSSSSSSIAAAGAVSEADLWAGSAAGWCCRMSQQFGDYVDVFQPVQLAVLEVRHGLSLLLGASGAAQQAAALALQQQQQQQSGAAEMQQQLVALTAGLLSFPPPLGGIRGAATDTGSSSSSSRECLAVVPASLLARPDLQQIAVRCITQQQQQQQSNSVAAAAAVG